MGIRAKCIDKYRDTNGNIFGYLLVDEHNNQVQMPADTLKESIRNNEIQIVNLILTSDNRLVSKEQSREKCDARDIQDIIYIITKYKSLYKAGGNYYWNKKDINKLADILSNRGISIYKLNEEYSYRWHITCGTYFISCNADGIEVQRGKYSVALDKLTCNDQNSIKLLLGMLEDKKEERQIGKILESIIYSYKNIIQKSRMRDAKVEVYSGRYENEIKINLEKYVKNAHKHAVISTAYIKMKITGDHEIAYKDECGKLVELYSEQWYNNIDELLNQMEQGFSRTIAEGRSRGLFRRW